MVNDEKDNDEIVESQISKQDKKEIERGLCVNCAIASFVITIFMMIAIML